jgi:hypothetical protein
MLYPQPVVISDKIRLVIFFVGKAVEVSARLSEEETCDFWKVPCLNVFF